MKLLKLFMCFLLVGSHGLLLGSNVMLPAIMSLYRSKLASELYFSKDKSDSDINLYEHISMLRHKSTTHAGRPTTPYQYEQINNDDPAYKAPMFRIVKAITHDSYYDKLSHRGYHIMARFNQENQTISFIATER